MGRRPAEVFFLERMEQKLSDTVLIKIDAARRALAEARSIPEVKELRDRAVGIQKYLLQKQGAGEAAVDAAELRLRAERRLGELLAEDGERRGGASKSQDATLKKGTPKSLPAGINKTQSHRFQAIAKLPEKMFELELAKAQESGEPVTTDGLAKIVRETKKESKVNGSHSEPTCTVSELQRLINLGKTFGTIYADPPWQYGNQRTRACTDDHYPTMPVDEIAALPIAQLAAPQSHLHLWTTNAFLFEAPRILQAWGFEYKSIFVWVKPQMGIGNYWRVSHEFLVLGVRGGLTFPESAAAMSWLQAARDKHSSKPESIRLLLEKVSPRPRLELFARTVEQGWTAWGDDIEKRLFDGQVEEL